MLGLLSRSMKSVMHGQIAADELLSAPVSLREIILAFFTSLHP